MREHSYLLFGEDRWALAQRWIVRVEGVDREETPLPLSLSALGVEEMPSDAVGHVLRLETPFCQMSLLVYGKLKSLQVKSNQVIELPQRFFGGSPASALILRDDEQVPALLLDPTRLHERRRDEGRRDERQRDERQCDDGQRNARQSEIVENS